MAPTPVWETSTFTIKGLFESGFLKMGAVVNVSLRFCRAFCTVICYMDCEEAGGLAFALLNTLYSPNVS